MKKSKILEMYEQSTGITYKHQPLFVGDVYKGKMGVLGMVVAEEIDGQIKYFFHKTNTCKHKLPQDRAGLNDGEFVANVVQDEELMKLFIENKIIEYDNVEVKKEEEPMVEEAKEVQQEPVKEVVKEVKEVEKPAKTKKATKEVAKEPTMNIYQKINAVRKAWAETNVEKEGKGRAGGGAKYDYYKPQQIIDFCLAQELKLNLYSRFNILEDKCYYEVINLDNTEEAEMVMCPFDVPRKMAASEAQQNGAAITYYNRRLAMTLYKIEDNSKESIDVLENADYSKNDADKNNAPFIPAPPIEPVAPKVPTIPVEPPKVAEVQKPIDAPKPPVNQNVATENEQKDAVPPAEPPTVPQVAETTPPWEDIKAQTKFIPPMTPVPQTQVEQIKEIFEAQEVTLPPVTNPVQTPPPAPKVGNIESLY